MNDPGFYTVNVKCTETDSIVAGQNSLAVMYDRGIDGTITNFESGKYSVAVRVRANTLPDDAVIKFTPFENLSEELKEKIQLANLNAQDDEGIFFSETLVNKTLRNIKAYNANNNLQGNFVLSATEDECDTYYEEGWRGNPEFVDENGNMKCQVWKPNYTRLKFSFNTVNEMVEGTSIQPNQLRVFRLNEETSEWQIPGGDVYINYDNTIELDVTHFSVYCVMGGVDAPEEGVYAVTNIANYPNPLASGDGTEFMFNYQAPSYNTDATKVTIKVYTLSGRLVKNIQTGFTITA
jgi:hypothetical protein